MRSLCFWLLASPGFLGAVLVIPLLVLIGRGMTREFLSYWSDPSFLAAVRLSLLTSTVSTSIVFLTGTPLAYVLGTVNFRGKTWVELALDVPLVLPPLIAGIALLLAFGRNGFLGRPLGSAGDSVAVHNRCSDTGEIFVSAPLYLRTARIGFASVPQELRE